MTIKELAAQKAKELKAEAKAQAEKASKGALPGTPSIKETEESKNQ